MTVMGLVLVLATLAASVLFGCFGSVAAHPVQSFALLTIASLSIYLLISKVLPADPDAKTIPVWIIIGAGIILRLAFFSYPFSDDVFRYAWEGLIQGQGINPYLTAPDTMAAQFAGDSVYAGINHPDISTAYPPLALLACHLVSAISYSTFAFKVAAIAVDCLTLVVIAGLLRQWHRPAHYLMIYAWHPLILFCGAGEGHIDVLHIFFIATALLAFEINRNATDGAPRHVSGMNIFLLLGCAVMVKYLAVLLLPFLVTRRNRIYLPLIVVPFLAFIPFAEAGMFSGLMTFSGSMAYNDVFPKVFRMMMTGTPYKLTMLTVFALGLGFIWTIFQGDRKRGMVYAYFWCILCLPCVHLWYLMPLVLLSLAWSHRASFLLFTTIGFGFWVLSHQLNHGQWKEFPWVWAATYIPVIALLIWDLLRGQRPPSAPLLAPESIDIVIPVLNEEAHLATMLQSLTDEMSRESSDRFAVYVVDGGSHDKTVEIAQRFDCQVLTSSRKGRGQQIATGVQAGTGDLIVMLHSDAEIHPGAFGRLLHAFSDAPDLCWGVLGHDYDCNSFRLRVVRHMNRLRFNCGSIAFGDQGIFVRRSTLAQAGGFPEIPLMEDVEISMRLQSFPAIALGENLTISSRRWSKKSFGGYFIQVSSFVLSFLIKRRLSCDISRTTDRLYERYYGTKESRNAN